MSRRTSFARTKGAFGAAPHSRPPLERMAQLHQLIKGEKFPNCRTLAAKLEVSSKTIQRDIDFMRDRWGLPIAYNQTEFGFYYTEPVTHFPTLEVSEGEVVALFIAQKALEQYRGTPFEKPLQSVCRKMSQSLGDTIRIDLPGLEDALSFRPSSVSRSELAVFEAVSRATTQSFEIAFHYHKLRSAQIELRRARPYHLACIDNQWYLFGFDLDREKLRTFALPRMRQVRVTAKTFERPAGFSINSHLRGSFGVFRKDVPTGSYKVRIRFDAWAARLVSERVWHESQRIVPHARGGIIFSVEVSSLEEIERWVLSWGEHAGVLAPKRLRDRIRRIALRIASS